MDYEGNTSSASAPASALGGQFEVFLSFWGAETFKTSTNLSGLRSSRFIQHLRSLQSLPDLLYCRLKDAGIRTFGKPHVGEEMGPAVLKAINESKISIPIVSWEYASSERCLRELEQMVECHKTMGNKILPIFWDVKPSDVRYYMGSHEEAFSRLQQHFDEKTVQRWKEAVRKVEQIKGWELKKEANDG
ncbi:TMV resistance protein N-like [Fagus crenata]